jgi:hypothetical protein
MRNKCAIILLVYTFVYTPAYARDDGRYANNPLKPWFDSLTSARGPCCSFADGRRLDDVDVDMRPDGYFVRIDGEWIKVPPEAMLNTPNRAGVPIVWPYQGEGGKTEIRCFIPGAGT